MAIGKEMFANTKNSDSKMIDFQDLDHIDGLSISSICSNLYKTPRDDLVMFYFREGANYASVYTQSKIVSENIKWNLNLKSKKIKSLIINTRNANAFTGPKGFQGLKEIAEELSIRLSKKQIDDEDKPQKVLNESIKTTFNAISCDGDTSTNDMVSLFSTNKAKNNKIK